MARPWVRCWLVCRHGLLLIDKSAFHPCLPRPAISGTSLMVLLPVKLRLFGPDLPCAVLARAPGFDLVWAFKSLSPKDVPAPAGPVNLKLRPGGGIES